MKTTPKPILRADRKPKKKLNHATPGYIYCFYDRDARLSKIGLSRKPKTRRYYLSKEYQSELEIVAMAPIINMAWGEKLLHKNYKDRHQYRSPDCDGFTEWFAMSSVVERMELRVALWLAAIFVNGCYVLAAGLILAFALMLIF